MGGKKSKQAGTSFEYRTANWFDSKKDWNGLRNPLSGASSQIEEAVGRHDVRAWHNTLPIFLQIECKKKTRVKDPKKRDRLIVQAEWIDKLDWYKDEFLVFATDRSPLYSFLPLKRFFQILGRRYVVEYDKKNTYSGSSQFGLNRNLIDESEDNRYHLKWRDEEYIALYLEEYVSLRETANLNDDLSFEDQIKRLTSIEKACEFEDIYLKDLNYKQKKLLYMKLEEFESGTIINPIMHSQSQFWLDKEAYVLTCPFCKESIHGKDLEKKPTE